MLALLAVDRCFDGQTSGLQTSVKDELRQDRCITWNVSKCREALEKVLATANPDQVVRELLVIQNGIPQNLKVQYKRVKDVITESCFDVYPGLRFLHYSALLSVACPLPCCPRVLTCLLLRLMVSFHCYSLLICYFLALPYLPLWWMILLCMTAHKIQSFK